MNEDIANVKYKGPPLSGRLKALMTHAETMEGQNKLLAAEVLRLRDQNRELKEENAQLYKDLDGYTASEPGTLSVRQTETERAREQAFGIPQPQLPGVPGNGHHRILRRSEAAKYCGIGESMLDAMRKAESFPTPLKLGSGKRYVGWTTAMLDDWLANVGR